VKPAGLLRVAALALIWGSGFLLIKISLRSFSPVQLTFGRLALGAVVLTVIVYATKLRLPGEPTTWRHLVVAALLANAIPYTLFGIAERTVDSSLAGAINATTPLWTVLFALAFRQHDRLRLIQWAGMLLGFAGALLILSPWQADSAPLGGVLACVGASASYGISYVYMGRFLTGRGIKPIVLSAAQLIAASGLLILVSPLGGYSAITWRTDAALALLALGIIGTGIAYVLNYRIITDDGPVLASTVTYLLPVVAVVLGTTLLDERVTLQLAVGVAVVLGGVALVRRART
jgi:drug/metabolite transporter (DMT)-like permease